MNPTAERVWGVYPSTEGDMEYMVRRVTYDKLQASLQAIAAEGWTIEPPTYVGGRDWVLVCKR